MFGDLVTGAATLDSEASQNQGTFTDCTNEATEIATSSGVYYLDLIATEMDTQLTSVIVKSATAGAKTTTLALYPKRLPVIRTGTAQAGAATTITLDSGASAVDDYYVGCYVNCTNDTPTNVLGQARLITDYAGSTKVATVESAWGTNPSSSTTFEILETSDRQFKAVDVQQWLGGVVATPTITGVPEVDVTHWLGTAAATPTVAGVPEVDITHFGGSAGTFSSGRAEVNTSHVSGTIQTAGDIIADTNDIQARLPAALVSGRIDASVGAMAAGVVTATAVATGAIDADAIASDAATEIRSLASGTSDSGTTTTMVDAARTEADTDYWKGQLIVFTSGNISGQARVITAFDAALDTITFAPATTQAVATQTYEIWPVGDFLRPTTSGRTLDVSAGGESGLDWANIGSPTTAQNLSATNIDVDQIVASVSGAVGSVTAAVTVGTINANVITATSIAADAITAAKVADGTIDAATFAAGAIDAAAIAANAIGASELAADVVAEIADAVWDEVASGHVTSGTFGQRLAIVRSGTAQAGAATTITLDTGASAVDDFYNNTILHITAGTGVDQSRIISDYVGSTKVATVATWATNPSSDSVFVIHPFGSIPGASAPTAAEVADAVWDEDATAHQTTGTFGQAIGDPVADTNTIFKAVVTDATGATVGVDVVAVKAETVSIQSDTDNIQTRLPAALVSGRMDSSVGAIAADTITAAALAADASAEIADAVWDEDATAHQTTGTFGQAIGDPVADTNTIYGAVVTGAAGATIAVDIVSVQADTDDLQSKLGTPSNLGSGATVAANLVDIEGQTDDIGIAGAGLTALGDTRIANLDATVSSRLATAGYTAPDNAGITAIKAKTDNLPSGIQKNTALSNFEFLMVDSTDHVTPKTGVTVTATRSIDGAAFGSCANAVTEVASGIYKINLAATDLNGDVITLRFTGTAADARLVTIVTEP